MRLTVFIVSLGNKLHNTCQPLPILENLVRGVASYSFFRLSHHTKPPYQSKYFFASFELQKPRLSAAQCGWITVEDTYDKLRRHLAKSGELFPAVGGIRAKTVQSGQTDLGGTRWRGPKPSRYNFFDCPAGAGSAQEFDQ